MGGRRHEGASLAAIEAAYREGFERFATVAAAIVGSQTAARDAVQEGFAAAIRNRRQFRGDGSLEGWLWRTVVNEARSQRRRRVAAESAESRVFDWVTEAAWDERLDGGRRRRRARRVAPEQQRLVIFLRYYADLTYEQIAEALELRPGTVAATLNRAHQVLGCGSRRWRGDGPAGGRGARGGAAAGGVRARLGRRAPPRRSRRERAAACAARAAPRRSPARRGRPRRGGDAGVGLRGKVASLFAVAQSPHPAAEWNVVGGLFAVTPGSQPARLTHVDPGTLRRIAAGGSAYRRVALLAGIGPDGRPWLAGAGPGWTSDFFPLFGQVGDVDRHVWRTRTAHGWDGWQSRCSAGRLAARRLHLCGVRRAAVVAIEWATLVGFVRGDVARVVVVGADGSRHATALGKSRGYAFATADAAALPKLVIALDASGRELAREPSRSSALTVKEVPMRMPLPSSYRGVALRSPPPQPPRARSPPRPRPTPRRPDREQGRAGRRRADRGGVDPALQAVGRRVEAFAAPRSRHVLLEHGHRRPRRLPLDCAPPARSPAFARSPSFACS